MAEIADNRVLAMIDVLKRSLSFMPAGCSGATARIEDVIDKLKEALPLPFSVGDKVRLRGSSDGPVGIIRLIEGREIIVSFEQATRDHRHSMRTLHATWEDNLERAS